MAEISLGDSTRNSHRADVLKCCSVMAIVSKSSRSKASGASASNHTWNGNTKSSRSSPLLSIRVLDTGTHFDRCHLRERGRHLALSYPSQDPHQCVGQLCLVEHTSSVPDQHQVRGVRVSRHHTRLSCSEELGRFLTSTIPRRWSC